MYHALSVTVLMNERALYNQAAPRADISMYQDVLRRQIEEYYPGVKFITRLTDEKTENGEFSVAFPGGKYNLEDLIDPIEQLICEAMQEWIDLTYESYDEYCATPEKYRDL